jgi:hypothetical protein
MKPSAPARTRPRWAAAAATLATLVAAGVLAGCTASEGQPDPTANPSTSVAPAPNYGNVCAPVGADTSTTCLRVTLQAIDAARAAEGLGPMRLPADFPRLSVPEQLFVVIDRERVDRGLAPFAGLSAALNRGATRGADFAQLPPRPGRGYSSVVAEWIGAVANGLDADYQWMYDDGPGSGTPGCSSGQTSGCWADRDIILGSYGSHALVMGAAYDPTGDTSPGDRGGSSLAATLASADRAGGAYAYTWAQALAATAGGTLHPLRTVPASFSAGGVADPPRNVPPSPDYTTTCSGTGQDTSAGCVAAALAAIDHARSLEGVRPMVLPADFASLSTTDQLFIAVNLERVDRGLAPFVGLTTALNDNAQVGADEANDPPALGPAYQLDDAEWAGGASNGLDAVYGWMYDDGFNSGNLDCTRRGAPGCWGHRKGILDDFGSGTDLVMGAAFDSASDIHNGDVGGTSMAVTLAVQSPPPSTFTYTWAQALATMPGVSGGPSGSG